MNFSFITHMFIPVPRIPQTSPIIQAPLIAFSADGSKFATATNRATVSVWDIRSKVPLKTLMEVPESDYDDRRIHYLQFSSGNLGKEALVLVEVRLMLTFRYSCLSNRWSKSLARYCLPSCNHSCD